MNLKGRVARLGKALEQAKKAAGPGVCDPNAAVLRAMTRTDFRALELGEQARLLRNPGNTYWQPGDPNLIARVRQLPPEERLRLVRRALGGGVTHADLLRLPPAPPEPPEPRNPAAERLRSMGLEQFAKLPPAERTRLLREATGVSADAGGDNP